MFDRRTALSTLVGFAAAAMGKTAQADSAPVRDGFPLKLGHPLEIRARSNAIKGGRADTYVIAVEKATFDLGGDSRLTAKLHAWITQMARIDYWISASVYDAEGRLLGAASHMEAVQRVMVGRVVMTTRDITLDFGISKGYARAAFAAVVVGERDLPDPPVGKG